MRQSLCLLLLLLMACHSGVPDAIDAEDKPVYFSAFKGKWLVINVWADWCEPCLKEVPELNAFAEQHRNDVVVLGLNYDSLNAVKTVTPSVGLPFRYRLLKTIANKKFGLQQIEVLPATYLIDPSGRYVGLLQGPQTQHSLAQAIAKQVRLLHTTAS